MQDLRVTLIQAALSWEDPVANLAMFDAQINNIREKTDLIVMPEMFTTGFTMNARRLAQEMSGMSVQWLKETARYRKTDLAGSAIIQEKGCYFNRFIWAKPDGRVFTYDKKHLFRMAGEEKVYTAGSRRLTVDLNGWNVRPFICYDLRFPVWTRNLEKAYDVALFVANWPQGRAGQWKALLPARAIENQCYVVGVNRVGMDGNNHAYSGDSSVIDPTGRVLFQKTDDPVVFTARLSRSDLESYRNAFPVWMDADK